MASAADLRDHGVALPRSRAASTEAHTYAPSLTIVDQERAALRGQLLSQTPLTLLFGNSERLPDVRDLVERVADTDVAVLIRGERGTGKELVARAVHAASCRRDNPFVRVNCAALPAGLLESELFGCERGVSAGALQHKPGKFEFAHRGTMFLDEIGEMGTVLQAKLLQVLQDGEFSRLGGTSAVRVDVRVVAATTRDLAYMVADGQFREDLFFLLNVVAIVLPPLRDRREDIPALTEYFVKKYSVQYNKPHAAISPVTMRLFMEHDWPGNVRELENLVRRAVVLGGEVPIQRDVTHRLPLRTRGASQTRGAVASGHGRHSSMDVEPSSNPSPTTIAAAAMRAGHYSLKAISRTAARAAECELISSVLLQTRWNRKETADILGISYKALLYKIKENGLDKVS